MPAKSHLSAHRKARTIAITSGKGGVGKSSITVNLAISLAKQGRKVCIFDADTGLANINIMLDLRPEYTIEHVILGEKTINEVMLSGAHNIRVIPGASGISECANLSLDQQSKLIHALSKLETLFDYILIDTAAGISHSVLHFVRSSQQAFVIVTPEPTSLTDTFSLIKILTRQGHQQPIQVIINMCRDAEQARKVFQRLARTTKKYINIELKYLSFLPTDDSMRASISLQHPVALYPSSDPASRCFSRLAESVERQWPNQQTATHGFSAYWRQLGAASPEDGEKQAPIKPHESDQSKQSEDNHKPVFEASFEPMESTLELAAQDDTFAVEETVQNIIRQLDALPHAPSHAPSHAQQQLEQLINQLTNFFIKRYEQLPLNPKRLIEQTMHVRQGQQRGQWFELGDKLHQVLHRPGMESKQPMTSEYNSNESVQSGTGHAKDAPIPIHEQTADCTNLPTITPSHHHNSYITGRYDSQRFGSQDQLLNHLQGRSSRLTIEQFLHSLCK